MNERHDKWAAAMRRGDFAAAWQISDRVLAARDPATRDDPTQPYHRRWVWDGRPFHGRHVLVRCYHGFGDTLQFARHLHVLRPLVASLTVEVQPELLPLMARVAGPDRLIPFILDHPAPPAECDIEIMELAHALRVSPADLPPPCFTDSVCPATSRTIGLCWQAGDWDPARSLSETEIEPLTLWHCLALQPMPTSLPVGNPNGCPRDIAGTASMIASLALVITADTMVAHLAGSLGRETWLLLKHDADWRWMTARTDSPWYPGMRLYRQPCPGDWPAVVARVMADLSAAGSRRGFPRRRHAVPHG